jgi:hypothetical protein
MLAGAARYQANPLDVLGLDMYLRNAALVKILVFPLVGQKIHALSEFPDGTARCRLAATGIINVLTLCVLLGRIPSASYIAQTSGPGQMSTIFLLGRSAWFILLNFGLWGQDWRSGTTSILGNIKDTDGMNLSSFML